MMGWVTESKRTRVWLKPTSRWLMASLMLALVGCHSLSPKAPQQAQWQLTGRVAIKTATQGLSADVQWDQYPHQSRLVVQGPLGLGRLNIRLDAYGVEVQSTQARQTYGWDDPHLKQFLLNQLLAPLPLESLSFWMRGEADPAQPSEVQGDGFLQAGWAVAITPAHARGSEVKKVEFTQGDVRVRLVVDQWQ